MTLSPSGPVLFIGHGSPMNAIRDTPFTQALAAIGRDFPAPQAVLCISAHWVTKGARTTAMERPRTIHDFYGFPKALFDIDYPARGEPGLAARAAVLANGAVDRTEWGLDHGAWAPLRRIYPAAHIPVVQMSIDATLSPDAMVAVGRALCALRDEGVMILGSGNIVHNLRDIDFNDLAPARDYATAFDAAIARMIAERDIAALSAAPVASADGRRSVPTAEHYLPLLYVMGAVRDTDRLNMRYAAIENASISMRTFSFEAQ